MHAYCEKYRKRKKRVEGIKSGTMLEDSPQFKRTQAEKLDVYFLQTVTKRKRLPERPYQLSI